MFSIEWRRFSAARRPSRRVSSHAGQASPAHLSVVEPLDDRVLLSASAGGGDGPPPAPTPADVFVTLAQGQEAVVADEVALLDAAASQPGSDDAANGTYNQLTEALVKLNDATYDLGTAVVTTAAAKKIHFSEFQITRKLDKATATFAQQLGTVNHLAETLGLMAGEDTALQKLNSDANNVASALTDNPLPADSATDDDVQSFIDAGNLFDQLDKDVVHLASASRKGSGGKTSGQIYLVFKFKLVAVKTISWSSNDPGLQQGLLDIAAGTLALLAPSPSPS